jgi:hypothetical protein
MDEPRGFPIRMTRLRWAHAGAFAAAAVGLFLPWVRAGSLSVRGIHTTPGVIFLVVLVLALIFAMWHGARTSNYWYALDANRVTGALLCLSWLVLLAVAVYESVHLASSHSPTTGRAEVLGIGLAIDTMAALVGSVVATIDAIGNWSQSQAATPPEDAEASGEAAPSPVTRLGMLRPIGAWAIAAVGLLAVAGAGVAGHNAGWTPIARPVSHTTHRPLPTHGATASRAPTTGSTGAPSTSSSTTTTTAPAGPNSGSSGSAPPAGNTGNTGAAFPNAGTPTPAVNGVTPPVGIGNTPPVYGVTPTPPVQSSGGNTGATGSTGTTGSTGSTGNTP